MNKLSKQAQEVVENFMKDKEIFDVWETCDHDGYDEIGPKSYLWDLYIIDSHSNKYFYHREYWFHGGDTEEYQLWSINDKPVS